jgi:hypothetical protein
LQARKPAPQCPGQRRERSLHTLKPVFTVVSSRSCVTSVHTHRLWFR